MMRLEPASFNAYTRAGDVSQRRIIYWRTDAKKHLLQQLPHPYPTPAYLMFEAPCLGF